MNTVQPTPPSADPVAVLKGFVSLRRLTGTYPAGHPTIVQKVKELEDAIASLLQERSELHMDIIHGSVFVDGVSFSRDGQGHAPVVKELAELGIDSIYIREGVRPEELLAVAQLLWEADPSEANRSSRSLPRAACSR